jgi:hypothetical protein
VVVPRGTSVASHSRRTKLSFDFSPPVRRSAVMKLFYETVLSAPFGEKADIELDSRRGERKNEGR